MKAITLYQPHASLVVLGAKTIETKSWFTPYRGPLAIHAASRTPRRWTLLCFQPGFHEVLNQDLVFKEFGELPAGKILCIVNLLDCVQTDMLQPSDQDRLFGDFRPGRFGWILDNVKRLDAPIWAKGHQGLWERKDPR